MHYPQYDNQKFIFEIGDIVLTGFGLLNNTSNLVDDMPKDIGEYIYYLYVPLDPQQKNLYDYPQNVQVD